MKAQTLVRYFRQQRHRILPFKLRLLTWRSRPATSLNAQPRSRTKLRTQQPYLVGPQEVSVWSAGPLFMHADTETFNALRSLLTALAARGQQYTVIAILKEFEAEAPSALGIEIGFADFDVLIARTDLSVSELKVSNLQAQHFLTNLVIPNPILGPVTIPHGWISVDGKLRGKNFRFITTHLEGFHPAV